MKILEAQSAVLTNWEVYNHLQAEQQKYAPRQNLPRRRGPDVYRMITKELLTWFTTYPSPLSQDPEKNYSADTIVRLVERLRPFRLLKGEMIMIMNLRPTSVPALSVIVEDLGSRFPEDKQEELLAAITEVLGQFEQQEEEGKGGEEGQDGEVEMQ